MTISPRRLGAGFVGTGFMGAVHSKAARANGARLVGVVGSCPERSEQAAGRLGIEQAYPSLDDLLADAAIDVVHVLTPNALHAEQAAAAIRAGKHVVVEKPLATTVDDAADLVALASQYGVVVAVPFVYRFHPMAREARARVGSAPVSTFVASYLQDWLVGPDADNWRTAVDLGGPSRAFADIGTHLVDLLEFVTGDRVRRLAAQIRTVEPSRGGRRVDTEDSVALIAELAGGGIGTLVVSQVAPGHKNGLEIEVATPDHSIRFRQEDPDRLWLGAVAGDLELHRGQPGLSADSERLCVVPAGHPQGYLDAFTAFVGDAYASIAGDHRAGLPTALDGLRAADVTAAVLGSARSGAWVGVREREFATR